jgi:hypothetical protein
MEPPGVSGSTLERRAKHMTPLLKPIVRKTDRPFMHYRTPLVVTLLPGDVISLRLLRHKREVVFNLHTLYYQGLRAQVAAEKRQAP